MEILSCEHLSKEFLMYIRDNRRVVGFSDVSFSLNEGEFLGISGPSGIGKSSLLKCIYRTYLPTSGTIIYTHESGKSVDIAAADDHEVLELRREDIGYVSQFFQVIPRVSAIDTVTKVYTARGFDFAEGKERAAELLTRLKLPESIWDLFPSTFSGGEKQRINIIHVIASEPRLLLLDEPTASLDTRSVEEVVTLIDGLKGRGTAMIGVFHNHELLDRLADNRFELSQPTGARS